MRVKFLNLEYPSLFVKGKGKFEASSKARNDVAKILSKNFDDIEYIPLYRHTQNMFVGVIELLFQLFYYLFITKNNEVIFMQYPIVNLKAFYLCNKVLKKRKVIALIHDLPSYRYTKDFSEKKKEIDILNSMMCLIVHSEAMAKRLKDDGVYTKMIVLKAFDYLLPQKQEIKIEKNRIVFAGALQKSKFLNDLHKCHFKNIFLNLYGGIEPNITKGNNIVYKGRFSPDDISFIEGDWGLLWDGDSVDCCSGNFGEYLKIIAPHKFSLYLACRLKIIVWKESAMAKFVEENKIGIVINNLYEIEEKINALSDEVVKVYENNVKLISENIRNGMMMVNAFNMLLEDINHNEKK